ncbi:fibronectin type III domain-containing protein [Marinimicrobium locisalis]|uniref:fibronectin type III domain-containing protein n=1 Tax=Marinimicrobium locisalis TaxID=546022 RepID=UPI003221A61A
MNTLLFRSPAYRRFHLFRYFAVIGAIVFSLNAHAGIGSVWSGGVTDSSITVAWTPPSGNYQLSGNTPYYKVCYKKKGTLPFICSANPPQTSNSIPHTLSGLDANTTYKIRVKCHCERKKLFGGWGWDRWRNISTMEVTTNASSVGSYTPSSFAITGTGLFSLDVTLEHDDMDIFESVRICHKKKYSTVFDFEYSCAHYPGVTWSYSDHTVGWMEATPAQPLTATVHPTASLKPCTKYDVVGFGYYPGGGFDKIGEAEARTKGSCGFMNIFQMLVSDYASDVLVSYAESLDQFYDGGLYPHLVEHYDENLKVARDSIRKDYQEDIADTLTLLKVLVESESPILERWQEEERLNAKGLSIERFMESEHPRLYRQLNQELQTRGADWGNPL